MNNLSKSGNALEDVAKAPKSRKKKLLFTAEAQKAVSMRLLLYLNVRQQEWFALEAVVAVVAGAHRPATVAVEHS